MKNLLIAITLSAMTLFSNAQAEFVQACHDDHKAMLKNSEKREVVSEMTMTANGNLNLLNNLEVKALKHYKKHLSITDESLVIQMAQYKDKKSPAKVNGFRVKIDIEGGDEAVVRYYFTAQGRMTKYYWDNQSPEQDWVCEGYVHEVDRFLVDISERAGEYFDPSDDAVKEHFKLVKLSEIPHKVLAQAKSYAAERTDSLSDVDDYPGYAEVSDENYAILLNGKVVGYAIQIWDSIDHPVWDGSGATLYIKADNAKIVEEVNWEG